MVFYIPYIIMMNRVRVAGIIPIGDGFALMHRKNVLNNNDYDEFYTFPGGGLEDNETLEQCVLREIKEELGIEVKIEKLLYESYFSPKEQKEYYFLCKYISGTFGTGNGPEFNNDPTFSDSGQFIPEIVPKDKICNILLLPLNIKEKFINDLNSFINN